MSVKRVSWNAITSETSSGLLLVKEGLSIADVSLAYLNAAVLSKQMVADCSSRNPKR